QLGLDGRSPCSNRVAAPRTTAEPRLDSTGATARRLILDWEMGPHVCAVANDRGVSLDAVDLKREVEGISRISRRRHVHIGEGPAGVWRIVGALEREPSIG